MGFTALPPKLLAHVSLSPLKQPQAWVRRFQTFDPIGIKPLPSSLFACPIRPDLIQRVTVWYRTGIRSGTACTKERGDVRGSIRKLYAQKGTGRARVGASRTNKRVGGGICFGPKPKDWAFHMPKKILSIAFRSALSAKYLQNELVIISPTSLKESNSISSILASVYGKYSGSRIMILDSKPPTSHIADQIAQLENIVIMSPRDNVNAYHLLDNKLLFITTRAISFYSRIHNDNHLVAK
ncbi:54S ribosomal protein yml6 [Mitosporidium daphniae]|uniref:Large ribosomal subunit protein uL4m n=1 Tax=Mitosporidium daphniae TaxID=1485682 RepID=A0A098VU00_9MICR|nr:uncharacterized protein DI09_172p20 [Mitosporidium daphniae]KGG52432.1 hypothetical protein DI09_172p20 [Mitosporidium daphniae]|eukprot:XP_013238868.1 uncharacterized protein DI09_172p20 [Mitosporidium daphniae]